MSPLNKIKIKKIMLATFWLLLIGGAIFLMVAALQKKEAAVCKGLKIEISGGSNNFFIDKQDIKELIQQQLGQKIIGRSIRDFNLEKIETELKKDVWLKKVAIFFDNNGVLCVEIQEREPLARVFTLNGESFYLDDSAKILPLSSRHTARLPVFTGFSGSLKQLQKSDSVFLKSIKRMGEYILKDSFLMSMIDQIDINKKNQFELIPKLGDQVALFGDTSNLVQKFEKFELFYKKVVPVYGWKKYAKINLEYKNQLVASIRGKDEVIADSIRTLKMMKTLAEFSSKMASDTTKGYVQDNDLNSIDVSMILNSLQREESEDTNAVYNVNKKTPPKTNVSIQNNKKTKP